MFFWVLLSCNQKILVPINHCDLSNVNIWEFYNGGGIGKKIPKLFYSANKHGDANFDLDISEIFIEGVDACYSGKVLACFGKKYGFNNIHYKQILTWVILGTEREAVLAGLLDENDIAMPLNLANFDGNETEIKQEDEEEQQNKRKEQIELLKKAAIYLRNRLGTNDILDGELADFQDVLNSDVYLTVNDRQFDIFSGYMDFVISVRISKILSYIYSKFYCECLYFFSRMETEFTLMLIWHFANNVWKCGCI